MSLGSRLSHLSSRLYFLRCVWQKLPDFAAFSTALGSLRRTAGSLLILFCSWFDLKFLPFVACLLSSCSSFSLLVMTVVLARRTHAVSARFYCVLDLEFAISDSVLFQPESRRTRVKSWRHSRNICRRGVKIPFVAGLWRKHQNWDWTYCNASSNTVPVTCRLVPKILIFSPIFCGFLVTQWDFQLKGDWDRKDLGGGRWWPHH